MKYILILLIPLSIFSQTLDYPDTLYLATGRTHACMISQIEEKDIRIKYSGNREGVISLIGVEKIFFNSVGIIYTKKHGYSMGLTYLQRVIRDRNIKSISAELNIPGYSSLSPQNNLSLILLNKDIVSIFSLPNSDSDSLTIYQNGITKSIHIESIVGLKKNAKSKFWKSASVGLGVGVVTGLLISAPMSSGGSLNIGPSVGEAALLGGLSGFLIGGIIGASSGESEIIDLKYMTPKRKIKKIQSILLKHK